MTNADDVRAKIPCSLYKIFCITNQIDCSESVEPWYGQIKQLADGADKWASGMHKAVIFGMYPELEEASKEFYRKYKDICNEFKNNPHQDREILSDSLKKCSFKIGEQYGLNKNRYLFNEMSEEQTKRVMQRKDIEIKNMYNESAEAMIDPLHIVMQGLCEKLTPEDCNGLSSNFHFVEAFFECEKENNLERMAIGQENFPESYSIYKQIKKSLEIAGIKDCYQIIDYKNYKQFAQTLGNFKYKGKDYNLLDVVRPITQKRDVFGNIKEIRSNTFSPSLSLSLSLSRKHVLGD